MLAPRSDQMLDRVSQKDVKWFKSLLQTFSFIKWFVLSRSLRECSSFARVSSNRLWMSCRRDEIRCSLKRICWIRINPKTFFFDSRTVTCSSCSILLVFLAPAPSPQLGVGSIRPFESYDSTIKEIDWEHTSGETKNYVLPPNQERKETPIDRIPDCPLHSRNPYFHLLLPYAPSKQRMKWSPLKLSFSVIVESRNNSKAKVSSMVEYLWVPVLYNILVK